MKKYITTTLIATFISFVAYSQCNDTKTKKIKIKSCNEYPGLLFTGEYEGEYDKKYKTLCGFGTIKFKKYDVINCKGDESYENIVYTGYFVSNKFNGKGKLTFTNGHIYEGDFVDNKRTGSGKYTWTDGSVYEGDFIDGKITGIGKFVYASGYVYEGDFVDGKYHGKGKFTATNGNILEGEFKENKMNGKGKFIYSNGDIYEGDFKENEMTGKGRITYIDGNVYEGDLVDGNYHGKGKFTFTNGNVYEGEMRDDFFYKGKLRYSNGNSYDGHFKENKKTGRAEFLWINGDMFYSEFIDGKNVGEATYKWSNGHKFTGKFTMDSIRNGEFNPKRMGEGVYTLKNSDGDEVVLQGNFSQETLNGEYRVKFGYGDYIPFKIASTPISDATRILNIIDSCHIEYIKTNTGIFEHYWVFHRKYCYSEEHKKMLDDKHYSNYKSGLFKEKDPYAFAISHISSCENDSHKKELQIIIDKKNLEEEKQRLAKQEEEERIRREKERKQENLKKKPEGAILKDYLVALSGRISYMGYGDEENYLSGFTRSGDCYTRFNGRRSEAAYQIKGKDGSLILKIVTSNFNVYEFRAFRYSEDSKWQFSLEYIENGDYNLKGTTWSNQSY